MDILNYNFSLISYWIRNTFSCAFIHHFWYTSQCERLERTTTLHGRFNQTLVRLRKSPTSLSDKLEIYGHSRVTETAGSGWTRLSGISRRLLIVAERAIRIEAEIFLFNFSITSYSSYLQCSTFLFPMKRKKNTNQLTPNVGNPSEVRNYAHKRLLVLRTRSAAFVYFPAKQSRCQQVRKLNLRKKLAFAVLYNMCHR